MKTLSKIRKLELFILALLFAAGLTQNVSAVTFANSDDGYTEEQTAIIDDLYNLIIENDKNVLISKNDIWCSEKSALNIYLLVGKAQCLSSEVYFEALYEVNGDSYIIYSLQSTLCGLLNSETEVKEKVQYPGDAEFTLKMIAFSVAKNIFPKAEVDTFVCTRVRGLGYYILTGRLDVDGKPHVMAISYEFKGDGYEYSEDDFHAFEVTLDGDTIFKEARIYR